MPEHFCGVLLSPAELKEKIKNNQDTLIKKDFNLDFKKYNYHL